MPNPINLSKVDITLAQFQEVSSGQHNAGEVKLSDEHTIVKVNHYVKQRGKNNVSHSQAEVLAVKNAFVQALSKGGVKGEELANIRRELGLEPQEKKIDKSLRKRTIKPLSRQQIRDILDRNAQTINDAMGANVIRTSAELNDGVSEETIAERKAMRESANSELDERRGIKGDKRIVAFQRVIAGDVDFRSPELSAKMLKMAKRMLETLLKRCNGHPRENVPAEMTWSTTAGDQKVVMDTGLDEVSFARKLEDIIVRLQMDSQVTDDERQVRSQFDKLSTNKEQLAFIENLQNDPDGVLKARALVVKILYDRGVMDYETLSLPNHLNEQQAYNFLKNLVMNCLALNGDTLRESLAVRAAREIADPAYKPETFTEAYVPSLSDMQYNKAILSAIGSQPENMPVTFRLMVQGVADEVRARYGSKGVPDNTKLTQLVGGRTGIDPADIPRLTPESLRPIYRQNAIDAAARNFLRMDIAERMTAAGQDPDEAMNVTNSLVACNPAVMERLCAAQSPGEARKVIDECKDLIADIARRNIAANRCQTQLGNWAREALASKLGVPVAHLMGDSVQTGLLVSKDFDRLKDTLSRQQNNALTDEEIEAAFRNLAEKWADERAVVFAKIDALKNISAEAKASLKTSILLMEKVDSFDYDKIADAASKVSVKTLYDLLGTHAQKDQIYGVMANISKIARKVADANANVNFAAGHAYAREIDPDKSSTIADLFIRMVVYSRPGLDLLIANFLQQAMKDGDNFFNMHGDESGAVVFMQFADRRNAKPIVEQLGKPTLPPFHAQALVQAVREEGFEDFTAEQAIALFDRSQPAGKKLAETLAIAENPVPLPNELKTYARTALRATREAVRKAQEAMQAVNNAEQAFLKGDYANRALSEGYHREELPQLASAFALYKVATDATDEDALKTILDPRSKPRRLMAHGGRFTTSVENFRAGLKLIDTFREWFTVQTKAIEDGKQNDSLHIPEGANRTVLNSDVFYFIADASYAYEQFVFEHLAIDDTLPLSANNPDDIFSMEKNPVMRFVGRGFTNSATNTFAQIPPAKRITVFAVYDMLAPLARNLDELKANYNVVGFPTLLSRILLNLDEIEEMRAAGTLTKASFCNRFFPDIPDAAGMNFTELSKALVKLVSETISKRLEGNILALMPITLMLQNSGRTIDDVVAAYQEKRQLPLPPYAVEGNGKIAEFNGTAEGARNQAVKDLRRPEPPVYIATKKHVLDNNHNAFVAVFPDNTSIRCARTEEATAIANKVEAFCGKVHPEQLSTVFFALSQAAQGIVKDAFTNQGIKTDEHMPLTYTFMKNDKNGDITIRYNEPSGFPVKFHWTTTVSLNGIASTTPLVIDELPPANA